MRDIKEFAFEGTVEALIKTQGPTGASPETVRVTASYLLKEFSRWFTDGVVVTSRGIVLYYGQHKSFSDRFRNKLIDHGIISGPHKSLSAEFSYDPARTWPDDKNTDFFITGLNSISNLRYGQVGRLPAFLIRQHPESLFPSALTELMDHPMLSLTHAHFKRAGVDYPHSGGSTSNTPKRFVRAVVMRLCDWDAYGSRSEEAIGKGLQPRNQR